MNIINMERLEETIYQDVLPNGLEVVILPKKGFSKTFAMFATRYGSLDSKFSVNGAEPITVPDGIAHFLEHKMFEEPTGDVFATFATQGASANAYTSFDRTAYLFSATEQIEENVTTLLDFVQNPYFTDDNVEKEKGIIEQEINMYRDSADWQVYYGLLAALYKQHPIRTEIIGSAESIRQITPPMLYECYETFYHPSNMILFIVGGVEPQSMMELVKANQASKTFAPAPQIERIYNLESAEVQEQRKFAKFPVAMPKCYLGCKEIRPVIDAEQLLRREITMGLILETMLGKSSSFYQQMYDDGLVFDSFGAEYNSAADYAFSVIGGETSRPDEMMARVKEEINRVARTGLDEVSFERTRKKAIGGYLRSLNGPSVIASQFVRYYLRGANMFELIPLFEQITIAEANELVVTHFDWSRSACSIVASEPL